MAYSKLFQFRGSQIHESIVADFQKNYPDYSKESDVLRHAIVLLDEKMRKEKGEDDTSLLKKEVKRLVQSMNTMKQQMDVLIKLNIELISRSGSDLSIEDMEQVVKSEIASAVTKRAEKRVPRTHKREQLELKKETEEHTNPLVQDKVEEPVVTEQGLTMVKDGERIVMQDGKPHKRVFKENRFRYEELEWEQIPEHRLAELK